MNNKSIKEPDRDGTVAFIIRQLLCMQNKYASWMEHRTRNISPGTWYILLLLFIVTSMGLNTWLIYDNLIERGQRGITETTAKKTGYPFFGESKKKR